VTIGVEGTCLVSAVATLDSEPRIAIGCVGAVPYRPRALEAQLGDGLDLQQARAAARGLGAELDPPSDVHGSADYRRAIAEVVVARAVAQASERGHR
jgi:carbon-monoxide dehydrogenase medium subunit